jgi:hypothetical protein
VLLAADFAHAYRHTHFAFQFFACPKILLGRWLLPEKTDGRWLLPEKTGRSVVAMEKQVTFQPGQSGQGPFRIFCSTNLSLEPHSTARKSLL